MASVEEIYRGYGVVHTDDCAICDIEDVKEGKKVGKLDKFLVGTLLIGVGICVGMWLAWQPLPYERIYRDFNTFKMYEDGSYEGEIEGVHTYGCISNAQCNN